jgi:hypothetical protein
MLLDKSLLLSCQEMFAVNHTIAHVFSEAMQILWAGHVKFNLFLIVTDAATYMKKPAKGLPVSYMIVHALNKIVETVVYFIQM